MKGRVSKNPVIFWLPVAAYCRNLATFSSKIQNMANKCFFSQKAFEVSIYRNHILR
jgi:hypothetical protein